MAVYETPSENADQPEPLGRDGDARLPLILLLR